ncbi:MAG TPA: histidine phosphatase family protein [Planctomycetota bacterium]|nr:histidine phosphatase family protein [Planctomycetota bacterium]
MSRIYVIRHAAAEEPGARSDFARRLTERGRWQAREAGRALRERAPALAAILTSPAARAAETAEIMAAEFAPRPTLEVCDALYGAGVTLDYLRARPEGGDVALVGHLPGIEIFARSLLSHTVELRFTTAAVCCIEFEGAPALAQGRLAWLLTP